MGREQARIAKRLEKNPIMECNRVQQKFYPELFKRFGETKDPRHQSYISYTNKVMLGALYYKGIAGLPSMQGMTREFNEDAVVKNLYQFLGSRQKEYLPHHVTVNEYLEKLEPRELEDIQADIVYQMIRRKSFNDAKVLGRWLVLVDGTELDEGLIKKNGNYLERVYNRGTDKEFAKYHRSVLEAKIYFGNDLVASIATENIENPEEYHEKKQTEEAIKQDCESKAFVRLAGKIKKKFPQLPICIVADGLYVNEKVMGLCKKNSWDYLIRYKEGCAKSIEEEYQAIPEKNRAGKAEYVNDIIYKKGTVNVLRYEETKITKGKEVTTTFEWITSIKITEKNAERLARAGRNRWKIENQGFNRQKHWQGTLEHACSWNENAQKNHYLMEQIADFMKQLYEYYYLKKNGIEKTHKKISSDLLKSFGESTMPEDTCKELRKSALS